MKLWQIKNILSDEIEIYDRFFLSKTDYNEIISDDSVIQSLGQSTKQIILTDQETLRLTLPTDPLVKIKRMIPIVEAYKIYGGDKLNEIIDYGSANVREI